MYFAWQLNELGYEVHFWTLPPNPLISYFDISSMASITKKVSYLYDWWPFTLMNPSVPPASIVVYITAERELDYFERHPSYMSTLHSISHMWMVNHHASAFPSFRESCVSPQCTVLHLARHIDESAQEHFRNNSEAASRSPYLHSTYVYPVFDLADVFHRPRVAVPPSLLHDSSLAVVDTTAIISESRHNVNNHRYLRSSLSHPSPHRWNGTQYLLPSHGSSVLGPAVDTTLRLVIQGAVTSKRRNYQGLFDLLEAHETHSEGVAWSLAIVGKGASRLEVPPHLRPRIDLYDSIPFQQYYEIVSASDFVLAALSTHMHYDSERATSTVPTAILAQTPVLLTQRYLQLYPCLQTSEVHQKVARQTEDDSVRALLQLTRFDLMRARQEAQACFLDWTRTNRITLKQILAVHHHHNNHSANTNKLY